MNSWCFCTRLAGDIVENFFSTKPDNDCSNRAEADAFCD